jgi:hypothetical protein
MRIGAPDLRLVTGLLSVLLCVMVFFASASSTPSVSVSEAQLLDDGQYVRTSGVLVDLIVYDGGAEALIIADVEDGAVLKVISSPGISPQPSRYARIGDEVRALGEVFNSKSSSIIYSDSDRINLMRTSEEVLTMEVLSRYWILFQGDEIRIYGFFVADSSRQTFRLSNPDMSCSIALRVSGISTWKFVSENVSVRGIMEFDASSMEFYIDAESITLAHGNPFLGVQRWALP